MTRAAGGRRRANAPGTADTPENLASGILIVLPPGFGPAVPEALEGEAALAAVAELERPRGLITAPRVDRGPEIPRLLRWLEAAGLPVGAHSRRFSVFTWPERWDGPQLDRRLIGAAAGDASRLGAELGRRRPMLVFFLSAQLLDALNEPEVEPFASAALGRALEPPHRLSGMRLRVSAQRRERALCAGLPLPRRTLSDGVEREIVECLRRLFLREGLFEDPLAGLSSRGSL